MRRRGVLGALAPTLIGGCLRLEGGSGRSTGTGTDRPTATSGASTASDDGAPVETTTPPRLVASAEMTEVIGSASGGEVTVQISNNGGTAFDGEVLLLFDREVQSAEPVQVEAGADATTSVVVDALDVGERQVSVEVRSTDVREVVFDRTLGTPASPVTLVWGDEYDPANKPRSYAYACSQLEIESSTGTLASYNIGSRETEVTFLAGVYGANPRNKEGLNRWFGGGDRGTAMLFEDVDLTAATRMRLTGHLAETLDSLPVVCRMGGMEVAEVTWERDGEHTVPLTLFD